MTEENKDLGWLIRDTTNVIRGPFSYHEVLQLLKKKQLKNKTEISRANSYWFALEEKPELFKFFPELNDGSVAESPTQMTATLTQADMNDQRVEITQFTPTPTRKELRGETNSESSSNESQVQWLSEEFADEFGEQVTEVSMKLPKDQDDISTVADKTSELMKRSSAKNDMLPSEDKQYKGTRPMPLDSLLKHPEKNQVVSNDMNKVSDGVVNMSVDHLESHAKIIDTAEEDNKRKERISLILKIVGGVIVLVVMAGSVFYALQASNESPVEKKQKEDTVVEKKVVVQGTHLEKVSRALTIYDAEELKNSISAWEQSGEGRADHKMYLAQAILRKEFSYDADGAYTSLQ
ncbi:MAG: hypothetical protein M9962_12830, partial [Oligoflexia bacterium]|nr:hypothetical protein [Oligoflexia bacterium]